MIKYVATKVLLLSFKLANKFWERTIDDLKINLLLHPLVSCFLVETPYLKFFS